MIKANKNTVFGKTKQKKEATILRPPCVLDGKSVLRLCLIFEIHEIQRDIAVNGMGGANATDFEPFDRFH